MTSNAEKQIAEIQETQEQLRESIERSKDLAAKTDKLLKRHRKTLKGQKSE